MVKTVHIFMHAPLNPVFFFLKLVKLNTVQIDIRFMLKNKLMYFSHSLEMGKHNLFNSSVIM